MISRIALALLLLCSLTEASTVSAQSYFGFNLSSERGIRAFEVLVQPGAVPRIFELPYQRELGDLEPTLESRGNGFELQYTTSGVRHRMLLAPSLPHECQVMDELLTQCLYAEFNGVPMPECFAPHPDVAVIVAKALRLSALLLADGAPVRLAVDGPAESFEVAVIAYALRDALDNPRSSVAAFVERLLHQRFLRLADPAQPFEGQPAALLNAASLVRLTLTSDGDSAFVRRRLAVALSEYLESLDEALWARRISVWTLTESEAASLVTGIEHGEVERVCGAANWSHPRFRRCLRDTLRQRAVAAADAFSR